MDAYDGELWTLISIYLFYLFYSISIYLQVCQPRRVSAAAAAADSQYLLRPAHLRRSHRGSLHHSLTLTTPLTIINPTPALTMLQPPPRPPPRPRLPPRPPLPRQLRPVAAASRSHPSHSSPHPRPRHLSLSSSSSPSYNLSLSPSRCLC